MSNTETAVQNYNFEGTDVRTLSMDGEPWFVGKDIASSLEYKNTRDALKKHVDEEDKKTLMWRDCRDSRLLKLWTGKDHTGKVIINESGMYSLIMGSKLDSAKRFKHWVTSEVLPSIRKHGAYMSPEVIQQALNDPNFVVGLATTLQQEQSKRMEAEHQQELMKPNYEFGTALLASKDSVLVNEFASQLKQKGFDTGEKRFFKWLRDNHYVMSASGKDRHNLPTQISLNQGLLEVKTTQKYNSFTAEVKVYKTTVITPKGQKYFLDKFLHSTD